MDSGFYALVLGLYAALFGGMAFCYLLVKLTEMIVRIPGQAIGASNLCAAHPTCSVKISPMDAPANERLRARLTSLVEACRAHYFRIKDAGDSVTDGERAEARSAYQAALEHLSRFLTDARRPRS